MDKTSPLKDVMEAIEEENVAIAEALSKAEAAYENHLFEKYNIDPAYFRLSMKVEHRDSTFTQTLRTTEWKDLG